MTSSRVVGTFKPSLSSNVWLYIAASGWRAPGDEYNLLLKNTDDFHVSGTSPAQSASMGAISPALASGTTLSDESFAFPPGKVRRMSGAVPACSWVRIAPERSPPLVVEVDLD